MGEKTEGKRQKKFNHGKTWKITEEKGKKIDDLEIKRKRMILGRRKS